MTRALFVPSGGGAGGSAATVQFQKTNNSGGGLVIGQAVYADGNDSVDLARADIAATASALGLAAASIASAATGTIQTDGELTATTAEWDAVTGEVGGLVAGDVYYLDETTAGNLTRTPTGAIGEFVVKIGTATSSTKLEIEIDAPVENISIVGSAPIDATYLVNSANATLTSEIVVSALPINLTIKGNDAASRTITLGQQVTFADFVNLDIPTNNATVSGSIIVVSSNFTDGAVANGDQLDIDFTPANYAPALPPEAADVDDLSAHLKGIDDALAPGSFGPADAEYLVRTAHADLTSEHVVSALTVNLTIAGDDTASRTITLGQQATFDDVVNLDVPTNNATVSGSIIVVSSNFTDGAVANGDQLDIDFTPANYTPALPPEAADVDDLSAHLKGIDDALASVTAVAANLEVTKTSALLASILPGQPVYLNTSGNLLLAHASSAAPADAVQVYGFAKTTILVAGSGPVILAGELTLTTVQWDAVTGGVGGLVPGDVYFLAEAASGSITNVAPTTVGDFVVRVGIAGSTTTLNINIGEPVEL